ncbi:MAG TPA: DoxX family protein [Gemmatimonadaceae bacterium]|nr:DoxX family protein [Gemmatimonadaceae bacterium]
MLAQLKNRRLPGWLQPALLSLLRAVTGALFMQHGVQKLFGLLLRPDRTWDGAPAVFSQMWFAGVLEVFGGALIVLGLFTRPVAFLLAGEMAFAYFLAHHPRAFWPVLNGGEAVVLFCFVFLYLFAAGAGPYSLDALIRGRRGRSATDSGTT